MIKYSTSSKVQTHFGAEEWLLFLQMPLSGKARHPYRKREITIIRDFKDCCLYYISDAGLNIMKYLSAN
ncbi:hypothetical protein SUGI_0135050 [Cryptomeria japonica]|nr:hypothetical protein SUGI_0135050 [Cryptomeria japonica]